MKGKIVAVSVIQFLMAMEIQPGQSITNKMPSTIAAVMNVTKNM